MERDFRKIAASRLREYAQERRKLRSAIERLADHGIDDDNYSPSAYTPCRRECRDRLEEISKEVYGYCLALSDYIGWVEMPALLLLQNFQRAIDAEADIIQPYPGMDDDSDAGYETEAHYQADKKADEAFIEILFESAD